MQKMAGSARRRGAPRRNAGVEALRIVAMLLIVVHHFAVHGGLEGSQGNSLIANVLVIGGKFGVNVFLIVTGYYLSKSAFSWKKPVRLLLQTAFYMVTLYLLAVALRRAEFSLLYLLEGLFPPLSPRGYGFFTFYLILYCLSPLMNFAIRHMPKWAHAGAAAAMLLVFSALPEAGRCLFGTELQLLPEPWNTLGVYLTLYLMGAYLRRFPIALYRHRVLTAALTALLAGAALAARIAQQTGRSLTGLEELICDYDQRSLIPMALSVTSLVLAQSVRLKGRKWLYAAAKATFGVFLIHDNYWIRELLWKEICGTTRMLSLSPGRFLVRTALCVAAVFLMCEGIELLRIRFLEEPLFRTRILRKM